MPSLLTDAATWRLTTAGGIKYKLMNGYPRGSYDFEKNVAVAEEKIIILASTLASFIDECYSFPTIIYPAGIFMIRFPRLMPGTFNMVTKSLSWEGLDSSMPVDPFSADSAALANTYDNYVVVTIQYESAKMGQQERDPHDPQTFLEVSKSTTREFVMLPSKGFWASDGEVVKNINVPVTRLQPEKIWNVQWPTVDREFLEALEARSDTMTGKLNSVVMPLLYNAPAETVMYLGMDTSEVYQFVDGQILKPAAQVTMKFLQKSLQKDGKVLGHRHYFREETGEWDKLQLRGNKEIFETADLNTLWQWI